MFVVVLIWCGRFLVNVVFKIVILVKRMGVMILVFVVLFVVMIEIGVILEFVFVVVGIKIKGRWGVWILFIL